MPWIAAAGLFQVLALGYMAAEREIVLRTGRTVYLRTVPVDPMDLFRGEYVRLRYEISRIPRGLVAGSLTNALTQGLRAADRRVYVAVEVGADGLGRAVSASAMRPATGLFLRGRVDYADPDGLDVRYGLEAFFVEQGRGREMEDRRAGNRAVPLDMEVAVGSGGLAVLKGFRWAGPDGPTPPSGGRQRRATGERPGAAGMAAPEESDDGPTEAAKSTSGPAGWKASLIAHYPFDPAESDPVRDASGHGYHGKAVGVRWVPGKVGHAGEFDGKTSGIDLGNSPALNPEAITVCAWVRTTSTACQWVLGRDAPDGRSYVFGVCHGLLGLQDGRQGFNGNTAMADGTFHHAAFVGSAATGWQMYLDGALDARHDFTGMARVVTPTQIGCRAFPGAVANRFDGAIDELLVFNRALSAAEIRQVMGLAE